MFTRRRLLAIACHSILGAAAIGFSQQPLATAAPPKDRAAEKLKRLAQDSNEFGFDLYKKVGESNAGNLFLSPASISTALAMTYGGAAGETAAQMRTVLHLDRPQDRLLPALGQLASSLTAAKQQGLEIKVANRLWGQQTFEFRPEYLKLTRETFGAELASVDFVTNAEGARTAINDWVAKQTKDTIKDLMPASSINEMTRLVLTNAIYFKADWKSPFTAKETKAAPFLLSDGKQVEAPLMFQQEHFRYHKGEGVQLLEMPYQGLQMTMIALLPEKPDGLAKLETSLTNEALQKMLTASKQHDVHVWFPKFKMASEFSLGDTLQSLGMTLAFDSSRADFTGMSGAGGLFISSVVHKAFVDVNEKGTEAAAATGVNVQLTSLPPELEPATFRADHPFLFLIRDQATGAIVFMGRVTDPTK